MKNDYKKFKSYGLSYIRSHRELINKSGLPTFQCINPAHDDSHPSAVYYNNNDKIYCPVCNKNWDIYDAVGFFENISDRSEQYKFLENLYGNQEPEEKKIPMSNSEKYNHVTLELDAARKIFDEKRIKFFEKTYGNFSGKTWVYKTTDGKFSAIDCRYDQTTPSGKTKKNIVMLYWNGKSVVSKYPPSLIYNIDLAMTELDQPIIINEGAKCAEICTGELGLVGISSSHGSNNAGKSKWELLSEHSNIIILPDDDEPGMKYAHAIQMILPQAKICKPVKEARKIKPVGADIEEILQVMSKEEVKNYILNGPKIGDPEETFYGEENHNPEKKSEYKEFKSDVYYNGKMPFRILGEADNGNAYFICPNGSLLISSLDALTPQKMYKLAPLDWWTDRYDNRGKISWDLVYNDIIQKSMSTDFNPDNIRSVGAWRESDGRICYHDGINTYGQYSESRVFLKKRKIESGIGGPQMSEERRREISDHLHHATFETKVDEIRLLGWAALAHFGGALKWRPAVLLTGDPGSGKSTLFNKVINLLSMAIPVSGGESTAVGIVQRLANSSIPVAIDESEDDTEKKRILKNDQLSLTRQSTSDESPKAFKGTRDGKGLNYELKSMFLFAGISSKIEAEADDKRIFRAHLRRSDRPKSFWVSWEKKLSELLNEESAKEIRSYVWNNLNKIMKNAERISDIMQEATGRDSRSSYADSLLFSAYFTVWERPEDVNNENFKERLTEIFKEYFKDHAHDFETRSEADDILKKITDYRIYVSEYKEQFAVSELVGYMKSNKMNSQSDGRYKEFDKHLMRYGIRYLQDLDQVAIDSNHAEIMRMLQSGPGYNKSLWRHRLIVEKSKVISMIGTNKRCVLLRNFIDYDEEKEKRKEKIGVLKFDKKEEAV